MGFEKEINIDRGTPYDYSSIMHYDSYTFSKYKNKPTIISKYESLRNGFILKDHSELSPLDIIKVQRLYGCKEKPLPTLTKIDSTNITHVKMTNDSYLFLLIETSHRTKSLL